jgi:hypothetical protein
VPIAAAPDLIGWTDARELHCYWKKQPETAYELNQAFKIFEGQELGCHRYAGNDPEIQKRVGYENCDDRSLPIWRGGAENFSKAFWKRISARRR